MKLFFFKAVISCPEGDWISIAKYVAGDTLRQLRKFLLGESESVRFHIGQDGLEVVYVLNLTQTQWHKLARLLIRRASYYRRWLQHQPGRAELCLSDPSSLGKIK